MDDGADIQAALTDAQAAVETAIAEEVAAAPTPCPTWWWLRKNRRPSTLGRHHRLWHDRIRPLGGQSLTTLIDQFQQAIRHHRRDSRARGFQDTTFADLASSTTASSHRPHSTTSRSRLS